MKCRVIICLLIAFTMIFPCFSLTVFTADSNTAVTDKKDENEENVAEQVNEEQSAASKENDSNGIVIKKIDASQHPFLLVRESEFEELRNLALQSPWKEMKVSAIDYANNVVLDSSNASYATITDKMSTAALAYILDPEHQDTYAAIVADCMKYWESGVSGNLFDTLYTTDNNSWATSIPPASCFFNTILAFDVTYNHYSDAERKRIEEIIDRVGEHFWANDESHPIGTWGVRGIYSLFKGDEERTKLAASSYMECYYGSFTADGASTCPSYMWQRFANYNRRDSKTALVDILEYTGYDRTIFFNQKFININEYLLGYLSAPSYYNWVFGDTEFSSGSARRTRHSYVAFRANNVSKTAAGYASWLMKDEYPRGALYNYLLLREPLAAQIAPASRIFRDGGGYFYENIDDINSNAGVMMNLTKVGDDHAHKETNSINIYGFGERLIANGGYSGWGSAAGDYSWDYINNRAISSNTVLIDYAHGTLTDPSTVNDHQAKFGAGIIDGFTAKNFDFVRGDSGSALSNGRHFRDFIMVHKQNGNAGYFITFDDVKANAPHAKVGVSLRPATLVYNEVTPQTEYQWTVKNNSEEGAQLSIFLATKPNSVEIIDGVIGDATSSTSMKYVPIKAMFNSYSSDDKGEGKVVTFMVPWKNSADKPAMARIDAGNGYSGGTLTFSSGAKDTVLESDGTSELTRDNINFNGESVVYRKQGVKTSFYFTRNSSKLRDADSGFYTPDGSKISVYMNGNEGSAYAAVETQCIFTNTGIKAVKIDGKNVLTEQVSDGIKVTLPIGESKIILEEKEYVPVIDFDGMILVENSNKASVGGTITSIDAENAKIVPITMSERTMVPLRFIAEGFDAYVEWIEATNEIMIIYNKQKMMLKIGEQKMNVAGNELELDIAPAVENGRTYVPLRAIAEAFGKSVQWKDGIIYIGTDSENAKAVVNSNLYEEIQKYLYVKEVQGEE